MIYSFGAFENALLEVLRCQIKFIALKPVCLQKLLFKKEMSLSSGSLFERNRLTFVANVYQEITCKFIFL